VRGIVEHEVDARAVANLRTPVEPAHLAVGDVVHPHLFGAAIEVLIIACIPIELFPCLRTLCAWRWT